MKPSIGRIVHFVASEGHAPAIITRVFSDTCVNLRVFRDNGQTPDHYTSVSLDEKGEQSFTWHWPERE
jgi:hypothetical protein